MQLPGYRSADGDSSPPTTGGLMERLNASVEQNPWVYVNHQQADRV
jgi:hypothetical protein